MNLREIEALIKKGALFVCNHSGGKDSQAMYLYLRLIIPASKLVVIYSHLDQVEWEGTEEHIWKTIDPAHRFFLVQARRVCIPEHTLPLFRCKVYHHSAAKFTSVPEVTLPGIPLESLPLIPEQSLPL